MSDLPPSPDEILNELIAKLGAEIAGLMEDYAAGALSLDEWTEAFKSLVARYHPAAYMAAAGKDVLTKIERRLVDLYVGTQFEFLENFARQMAESEAAAVAAGTAFEFKPAWRSRALMYAQAIKAPYWAAAAQMLPLPAMPGDGTSQCVVSGESCIITPQGLVAIKDIKIGDPVLTHRGRFRRVMDAWQTKAGGNRMVYSVQFPGHDPVFFTGDHQLLTDLGWVQLFYIGIISANVLYCGHENQNLSVWETNGQASEDLCLVRQPNQSHQQLAQPNHTPENNQCIIPGRQEIFRYPAEICKDVGGGQRADSAKAYNPSQRWQSQEWCFRKLAINDLFPACIDSSSNEDGELPNLSKGIQTTIERQTGGAEILFYGLLPPETTLYDLTVEDDESFVVEGIPAHNCLTRCRCHWRIEVLDKEKGDYDCFWELSPVEHCQTCKERAKAWNPLQIREFIVQGIAITDETMEGEPVVSTEFGKKEAGNITEVLIPTNCRFKIAFKHLTDPQAQAANIRAGQVALAVYNIRSRLRQRIRQKHKTHLQRRIIKRSINAVGD